MLGFALVINWVAGFGIAPAMLAADPVGAVNDIVEERLAFGLPADAESIRAATAEGLAKAQAEWGVAMTEGRAPDQASEDKAQAGLGVRISVNTGSIEDPAVCNSRDDCHTPMRAGIRIVNNANKGCSMGFMISKGSDLQFMTTGHCSFNSGTSWSHTGYGPVGAVLETEYQNNRWDIMRVAMPDNEATNRIYAEVRRVQGRRDPIQGEAVCASLGRTDALACGTIADADVAYNDGNGLHIVNATGLTGINIQGGDSGSPVYVRSSTTQVIAVALAATDTSDLASKLGLPLSHWSADVVYGGP